MSVLVKFSRDWADEFQVEGFRVVDAEKASAMVEFFSRPRTFYFGTNEGWEDEVLLDSFEFVDISDEQASLLAVLFGRGVGEVPVVDLCSSDDEEDGF